MKGLPPKLMSLTFGNGFNKPINKGNLPNSITYLKFGYMFNQPINKDSLPSNLERLIFGFDFNQPINEGSLPKSLKSLCFDCKFNHSIDKLPDTLEYLSIYADNVNVDNIPNGIQTLKLKFKLKFTQSNFSTITIPSSENLLITNIPSSVNLLMINNPDCLPYIKRVPFGCKITYFEKN